MSSRRLLFPLAAATALAALGAAVPACSSTKEPAPPQPVIACSSAEIATGMDVASDVQVFVDASTPQAVTDDLGSYLSRLWKRPATIKVGVPDGATGDAIWVSSSAAARAKATPPAGGYALVRADEGARKVIIAAADPADVAAAAYALLEELGVRFFHPMQELVPELEGPRFPKGLNARRTPSNKVRGIQIHTLHPLEFMASLLEPSAEHLAESKRLVDWLVKTGQNHLQWPLLGSVDWPSFAEHARQIVAYAHARGVTVGGGVNIALKGSLQRNYVLVREDAKYVEQIAEGLNRVLEVPFDDIEISMGEFLAGDPERLVTWLDAAVAHLAKAAPKVRVSVQNHVGNYPELYVDFRGQKNAFFYQIPQYADPRLGQTVHTLFWFDLYRDQGMYKHPNFHFQREFMFAELAKTPSRRVRYLPESAYWIAADVDVPVFLPEFIESRWIDIQGLDRDTRAKGLPPVEGHVMFSSGYEWGFWMTDYLAAKMMWDPGAPLDRFVTHYASAYGSCGTGVASELTQFIQLQKRYLFEQRLIPYVSGEDATVETGAALGIEIRPIRKKFELLVRGTEAERAAFEAEILAPLEAMANETRPIEDSLAARCRGADPVLAPWCNELRDGVRIVRVRLEHAVVLYRGILAHARGDADAARKGLAGARVKTAEAKTVIEEREKGYRFPLERLTGAYNNPTFYPFGYLRQAHTQCLWHRREELARLIIEEGVLDSTSDVPRCLE